MSVTNPASLLPGLSYPAANELARQIDGTADAAALTRVGFSYPVAVELARQMVAGVGQIHHLRQCGMDWALATAVKTAIDA